MRLLGFLTFVGGAAMALAFYYADELGLSRYPGMGENQFLAFLIGTLVAACGLMMMFVRRDRRGSSLTPPPARRRFGRR